MIFPIYVLSVTGEGTKIQMFVDLVVCFKVTSESSGF